MDAARLEPGSLGQRAEDEERTRPGEPAAARVEEQLGSVAAVEKGPAAREIAAEGLGGAAADRNYALLPALAGAADEPLVEVDRGTLEPDRFADAEPGAVEELYECTVPERPGRRAGGRLDQPLDLSGRQRPGQRPRSPGCGDRGGRVVLARTDQRLVAEERAQRCEAAREGRARTARRAQVGQVALDLLGGSPRRSARRVGARNPRGRGGSSRPSAARAARARRRGSSRAQDRGWARS